MRSRAGTGRARGPLRMAPRGPWSPNSSNSTGVGCGSYSSLQRKKRREIVKREKTGQEDIYIHKSKQRGDEQWESKEEENVFTQIKKNTKPQKQKESLKEMFTLKEVRKFCLFLTIIYCTQMYFKHLTKPLVDTVCWYGIKGI